MNTILTPARVALSIQERFNPTKGITADALIQAHDEFDRGNLRSAAMIWEVIEDRDDLVKCVAAKRKKNIARNGFEVVTFAKEGSEVYEEALKQKRALEFFYDQVLVTHAIDGNERGGFKLLVRQMMDAIGKKYAVHEIVWKVVEAPPNERRAGTSTPYQLTAELRFVPLWFFECVKGELRFLIDPHAMEGVELKEGAWLVTVGDGIMKPCAIAWMRKNLALSDWSDYSGNYGKPGIIASTGAARGSDLFNDMEAALDDFLNTKSIVMNAMETVKVVDMASENASFESLVERMDRLISALWRGSDLSTISKSQGYGASVQQGETQILEEDDAQLITETLQKNIDRRVIEYTFGSQTPVLAGVTIQQTPQRGTQQDMMVDQFLVGTGMPLGVRDAARRYGRAIADPGESILIATSNEQWAKSMKRGRMPKNEEQLLEAEAQFAPHGNRKNNPNLLNR